MTPQASAAAGSRRDDPAPTRPRLHRPHFKRPLVDRERLLNRLAGERGRRVLVLCAPAGFGKTIVALQLSRAESRPTGWLAIAETDNDPVVLREEIAAVLEGLGAPRVDGPFRQDLAALLATCPPFQLVFDDVDVLTQSSSLALVSAVIDEAPEGSQVVLASRSEPGVPLGPLRAAGEVLDVRTSDLALDSRETRELLATAGLELSDEQVEVVRERTEGWAAGIALAMLSSGGGDDLSTALIGRSPDVARYLLEEAVERQPEDVKHFLLASSVLGHMSPALCDAALEIANSSEILAKLEHASLFVASFGTGGEWHRYHHLFRELLQQELRRRAPDIIPGVLRRAAAWHEANGDPDEAFAYAHAAGDLAGAGRVLLRAGPLLIARGQIETLRAWLGRCTAEEQAADAQLAIGGGWIALLRGDASEANRLVAAAETIGGLDVPSPDGGPSLHSWLANVRGTLASRGISQMLRDGEFVCAAEGQRGGTRWVIDGWRHVGTAHLLAGRPAEAIAAFDDALALIGGDHELDHLTIYCRGYSALAAVDLDDWPRARRWARDAHALANESGLATIAQSAPAHAAHATVLLHDGLLPQAARTLADARVIIPTLHALRWLEADISLRCAEITLALGAVDEAWKLADVARGALAYYPDPGVLPDRLASLDTRLRSGRVLALTPGELRVVPLLPSHLSLQEIGERMALSRATVKTHTVAIYRKLDVPGRSEAVERLEALGFFGPAPKKPSGH